MKMDPGGGIDPTGLGPVMDKRALSSVVLNQLQRPTVQGARRSPAKDLRARRKRSRQNVRKNR